MYESSGDLLAEGSVLPSVKDERVPSDVDQRSRREAVSGILGHQLQEAEGFVHDLLGHVLFELFVNDDALDESAPRDVVDEALVDEI